MRTLFTTLLLSAPLLIGAQNETIGNSDFGNISALTIILFFFLLIVIAILLICREAVCWYFKINKIEAQQHEILRLLKERKEKK